MDIETTVTEIAPDIYRLSTFIPEVAAPSGFSFNQFLIAADEPLLFHTGPRTMFPLVAEAVARVLPVESLRWVSFGHVESDECGAMNLWLAAAPDAQVAYAELGCETLNDLCDVPPRVLAEGEVVDLGGKRVRQISTPHVPHGWEAQVLFEETTGTLLCGDLFSHVGGADAPLTTDDLVERAMATDAMFGASSWAPQTPTILRSLAELAPTTLAVMHGSSFSGDAGRALADLAAAYEGQQLLAR